jgi:bla regulator protein blaR1
MSGLLSPAAPWIATLGWTLLHFLWQGLAVGAGFALARHRLREARCDTRYAAGLVALALLAACPPATFLIVQYAQGAAPAAATALLADSGAGAGTAVVAATAAASGWLPWLVAAWAVGVLSIALRALYQWRVLARIVARWSTRDAALETSLASLCRRFGLLRPVRLLVSARIDTPTLVGWLKPVILLPTSVALGFPRQQVELILAHELGHLRRYDHLINLAQSLLEIVLYYHPVVHWISREVRNEREICCDELVLRITAEAPREYARTLAALEELRQPPVRLALAASGGVLLDRVRRIVGMPVSDAAASRSNGSLWLLVAFGLALAVSALRLQRDDTVLVDAYHAASPWAGMDLRVLPQVALGMPRLHLRLAPVAAPIPVTAAPTPPARSMAQTKAAAMPEPSTTIASPPSPVAATAAAVAPALANLPARVAAPPVVTPASAPLQPAAPAPAEARPRLLHMVAPEYPGSLDRNQSVSVEASYTVAADGSVRDVAIDAGSHAPFARSIERALSQWRYAPAVAGERDPSRRYRQAFVFGPRFAEPRTEEAGCIRATGSHICRPPAEGTNAHNLTIVDLEDAR